MKDKVLNKLTHIQSQLIVRSSITKFIFRKENFSYVGNIFLTNNFLMKILILRDENSSIQRRFREENSREENSHSI